MEIAEPMKDVVREINRRVCYNKTHTSQDAHIG